MSFASACIEWQAAQHSQALIETWGHLAPKRNRTYKGHIVFALGCFGNDGLNPTALECEFDGLDSSPWFYEAMCDFLHSTKGEEGNVYRFDGHFRNYKFVGNLRQLI